MAWATIFNCPVRWDWIMIDPNNALMRVTHRLLYTITIYSVMIFVNLYEHCVCKLGRKCVFCHVALLQILWWKLHELNDKIVFVIEEACCELVLHQNNVLQVARIWDHDCHLPPGVDHSHCPAKRFIYAHRWETPTYEYFKAK